MSLGDVERVKQVVTSVHEFGFFDLLSLFDFFEEREEHFGDFFSEKVEIDV